MIIISRSAQKFVMTTLAWLACMHAPDLQAGPGLTASRVTEKTGVSGGLCVMPCYTSADLALALDLAAKTNAGSKLPAYTVLAFSADSKSIAQLRETAWTNRLLGRTLYAEVLARNSPLPLADRLADIIIVADPEIAGATGDQKELRPDWKRVLAPVRGAALFGDTVVRSPLPDGSDAWSHRCHGPDNVQTSSDTTLRLPLLAQWYGPPRHDGFWGSSIVAGNGRYFSIRAPRNFDAVCITARSLTSGLLLWQTRLESAAIKWPDNKGAPGGGIFIPGRSCIATGEYPDDSLYLTDRDGVARLNPETGIPLCRIPGPKKDGQIKWLAVKHGLLAMLAGDRDNSLQLSYQMVAANPSGRELAVVDLEGGRGNPAATPAGKELWRATAAGDIDERLICLRDDRLYTLTRDVGLECRELKTGKLVWSNNEASVASEFRMPEPKTMGGNLFSQPELLAMDNVVMVQGAWSTNILAFSRTDGHMLWKKKRTAPSRGLASVLSEGAWRGKEGSFDLKTGEPLANTNFLAAGCGQTLAIPGHLITCFGGIADLKSGQRLRLDDMKSPCDSGTIVSEGTMVTEASECGCIFELKGCRALCSAGSVPAHAKGTAGSATVLDAGTPKPMPVDNADWPAYRHDAQRSGATPATVGGDVKILWQWQPDGAGIIPGGAPPFPALPPPPMPWIPKPLPQVASEFMATAPVAAGGFIFFGSHDGTVHCLRADSGAEVWKFPTGGMLFAPPTVCATPALAGRLMVGGGDGRIYCLDINTGKCLWQFQTGPCDRRMSWYGHLIGTWPVLGGVVEPPQQDKPGLEGLVCAVAGYQSDSGIHAYGINARSGKVVWEKHDSGNGGTNGIGMAYSSVGNVTVGQGRLWLCSSTETPGSFDLENGAWQPLRRGGQFGGEIGMVAGQWIITGGRRIADPQEAMSSPQWGEGFQCYSTASAKVRKMNLVEYGISLPAWSRENNTFIMPPPKGVAGELTALPADRMFDWIGVQFGTPAPQGKPPLPASWVGLKTWMTAPAAPAAFVLAKDQVVVATVAGGTLPYKLTGFKLGDGSKVWSVDLPARPAMNRIAIDRDGRILLSLCDGSLVCAGHQ